MTAYQVRVILLNRTLHVITAVVGKYSINNKKAYKNTNTMTSLRESTPVVTGASIECVLPLQVSECETSQCSQSSCPISQFHPVPGCKIFQIICAGVNNMVYVGQ